VAIAATMAADRLENDPMTDSSLPADVVPLIPMRNAVLFPNAAMPVGVGRPKSVAALRQAAQSGGVLGIVLQRDALKDEPSRDDLCDVGTLAQVLQQAEGGASQHHAMVQGTQRFRIEALVEGYPFLAARITRIVESAELSPEAEALGLQLHQRAAEILALLPSVPAEVAQALAALRDPRRLSDLVAHLLDIEVVEKQQLLEALRIEERLSRLLELLARRIQVLRLSHEIGERTKEQLDDRQRKYLLREQLKTIQKELGEGNGNREDLEQLSEAIAKAGMPDDVRRHVDKELERLERMGEGSSESAMLRTWLEWMAELPWAEPAAPTIDLDVARRILEDDHHGLEMVKRRIVEYLAVLKLNPSGRAPILCFVGPPGVGKTSLGQSIARALGRPFVRVSLGGVHDEAEIRGHRRTYVGALPGTIIQGIRKAGARHCVMMLDEVDKLSASFQGDPSAALLEVLDPEQNGTFRDNYLGVPFDLSRVVFIATANVLEQISLPVRDRMEVIELPGYTQEEKVAIARRYLVQRQREACGLAENQVVLADDVVGEVVAHYTREAGVRQLEREIGRLMRHAALQVASVVRDTPVTIDVAQLDAILGPPRFEHETALRSAMPGVATGLAWTPVGGDILFIEATRVPGSGRLILTGQLGDVMKESAQAALTLVKSRAASLGIPASMFEGIDVHLHVPAGAIPKDGPSAGVAMFMALASLFADRSIRPEMAMTGEISLRGLVLPVGGIKEKVLAAQRAGVRSVLLPARNRKDLHDIPASTQTALQFVWLEQVDDALRVALTSTTAPRSLQLA
jgi:ATP-dependent Lon protease